MKIISPRLHGIVDYVTILFLGLSPFLFHMNNAARIFTFALGIVHLSLTLLTDFDMGIFKVIPLKIHGTIEVAVSVVLIFVAFIFRKLDDQTSFYYYLVFSLALFLVWLTTSYTDLDVMEPDIVE
jgi:hypothetical protein